MSRFKLGKVVQTRKVFVNSSEEDGVFAKEVEKAFVKFINADWGITSKEDKALNDEAILSDDERIVAKYPTCKGDIFIITEADRSATTILFCDEY